MAAVTARFANAPAKKDGPGGIRYGVGVAPFSQAENHPHALPMRLLLPLAIVCALSAAVGACGPQTPQTNGYKPGVHPGMTKDQVESILAAPKSEAQFSLPNKVAAYVMTYGFGQVLLENGKVVAITVVDDPTYTGPFGIKLGIQEDAMKAAFKAHKAKRTGRRDAYDVVVGTTDTRTRDYYDETDGLIIELAAANPNDPLAPFNVISITEANADGLALMTAITKAKVGGLYPDQHVFNFVSEPWST